MYKISVLLFFVVMSTSCSKEDSTSTCDVNRTYTNTVSAIINKTCAVSGCHSVNGSGNGIFDSYDAVKVKVDNGSFKIRVVSQSNMPPVGAPTSLTVEERAILSCWIDNGAKK
ncbi:MAG: hypothetical protein HOP11_11690 [Saprospiraceae bacterium]|nr:hypothetical protein [Saprospiraceae bacterium]